MLQPNNCDWYPDSITMEFDAGRHDTEIYHNTVNQLPTLHCFSNSSERKAYARHLGTCWCLQSQRIAGKYTDHERCGVASPWPVLEQ